MQSVVAPAVWDEEQLGGLGAEYALGTGLGDAATKYNPTPGGGCVAVPGARVLLRLLELLVAQQAPGALAAWPCLPTTTLSTTKTRSTFQ